MKCCCRVDSAHSRECEILIEVFSSDATPNDPTTHGYRFVSKGTLGAPCLPYAKPTDPTPVGTDSTGAGGAGPCAR